MNKQKLLHNYLYKYLNVNISEQEKILLTSLCL